MSIDRATVDERLSEVLRDERGRLTGALVRILGDWDLAEELVQDAAVSALEHWAVDGIPRNRRQVALLAEHVQVVKIFKLSVYDEALVIKRLLKRAQKENRPDDTKEVIQHRLDVYRAQTETCIQAYKGTMLTRIQADQPIFDVHLDIVNSLHKMRDIHFP